MKKEVSDLTFPNVSYLKEQCLSRAAKAPLEMVTAKEAEGVINLSKRYIISLKRRKLEQLGHNGYQEWYKGLATDPAFVRIDSDVILGETKVPKWIAISRWLETTGIVTLHPKFICAIARHALDGNLGTITAPGVESR